MKEGTYQPGAWHLKKPSKMWTAVISSLALSPHKAWYRPSTFQTLRQFSELTESKPWQASVFVIKPSNPSERMQRITCQLDHSFYIKKKKKPTKTKKKPFTFNGGKKCSSKIYMYKSTKTHTPRFLSMKGPQLWAINHSIRVSVSATIEQKYDRTLPCAKTETLFM